MPLRYKQGYKQKNFHKLLSLINLTDYFNILIAFIFSIKQKLNIYELKLYKKHLTF